MQGGNLQKHWLRLVLFCVGWLGPDAAFGQQTGRTLFPQMPQRQSFSPTVIEGVLPEWSGLKVTASEVRVAPEPLRRNGKTYWEIDLYYDREIRAAYTLRQQGDTIWVAINPEAADWVPDTDTARTRSLTRSIEQLHQVYPEWFGKAPKSFEEDVFFRFNARIGDTWSCLTRVRGGFNSCWVTLDTILTRRRAEPLYVFSLSNSSTVSHMPQLMKLVVSKTKGIRGMQWYDYACWEPYDCEDLLVRYGTWE